MRSLSNFEVASMQLLVEPYDAGGAAGGGDTNLKG